MIAKSYRFVCISQIRHIQKKKHLVSLRSKLFVESDKFLLKFSKNVLETVMIIVLPNILDFNPYFNLRISGIL